MLASFVLRLDPEALAQRQIIGRAEAVWSAQETAIRSAEELISFLYGSAAMSDEAAIAVSRESKGVVG
ncbi:MAG: hypothetical protein JO027_00220 [Solirubrobacterales bacterium]|nr:hypothetical protein [Solirubrobacterales bacterium]